VKKLLLAALTLGAICASDQALAEGPGLMNPLVLKAHEAILAMELDEARKLLDAVPSRDPDGISERALLAVYEGDCDAAVALLERHGMTGPKSRAADLVELARGCARVTAATTVLRDEKRGFVIRFKDEDDLPLAPFLMDVAEQALVALDRDLQVRLPRPLRIDLVRDHFSLAAMTGLPEESAQTTGTVAIAKWGRVTMLSPRAMAHGYGWADTLMHELTHLAISRASHDRAPLWLQEGVAKYHEVRWRAPLPFDHQPSPDAVARLGFERGLGLPLDKLGPSIAMLPTAEQAMVAFAEVHSFLRYWLKENGKDALGPFLHSLATVSSQDGVDVVLKQRTGQDLAAWSQRWQASLASVSTALPPDLMPPLPPRPGEPPPPSAAPSPRALYRSARVAELLEERGHLLPAVDYAKKSQIAAPHDPAARARLARPLRALGRHEEADPLVEQLDAVRAPHGLFLALHGALLRKKNDDSAAQQAFTRAVEQDPLRVEVACELVDAGQLPAEAPRAALCRAVRDRAP
jgi:hypothetical protein